MKPQTPKFSKGSLFICSKCGVSFDQPEQAEKLKTSLRGKLRETGKQTEVRVMVSSCLGVCIDEEQAFGYYPNEGKLELYTTSKDFNIAEQEILDFIHKK